MIFFVFFPASSGNLWFEARFEIGMLGRARILEQGNIEDEGRDQTKGGREGERGQGGTKEGTKEGRGGSSSRLLMKRLVMVVALIFPPIQPSPCIRKF